jgi:transposase
MIKTRREFAPEFKREAVALLESSGRPLTQVAVELGIQPSMLRAWRTIIQGVPARSRPRANGDGGIVSPGPSPADLASQNMKLKRDLDRVRMERDVLKKAIGIFAEVPR